ncbi:MAG: SUMF1/EgtB/PvdO family nonheme iron enzyme, partial [Thermoguttaceae bacterium]|nr:SUMF1/EgtB/PvdO family nonheme iron enzyme [Thermoguttaceae bacterium]
MAFLQSCGSREFSWEDKKLGGGIFTYYFVEGLGGAASTTGDGVTFQEVCGYARRKTTERTQELGVWLQRPFGRFKSAEGAAEPDSDFYLIAPKKPKEAAAKLAEAKESRASGGLANLRAARRLLDEAFGLYRYMDATKEAVVAEREATTAELASALADEAREKLDVDAFDDAVSLAKEAVDAFESLKTPNDEEPPFVPPKYRDLLTKCERRRDAWRLLDEAENALGAGNRATAASKVERSLALWDSPRGRDLQTRIEKASAELPEDYLSAAGIEFRLIKPGSFMMGNTMTPEEIHEKYPGGELEWYQDAPRHKVTLTEPFYMAKYETTVAEFKRFVDAT